MAQTPEGKVTAKIKDVLKREGIQFSMPSQTGYGIVGILDFICCRPGGRYLAIEAKAPGKRNNTSTNQKVQLFDIREVGGDGIVVDDVQQLEDYLNGCYQESSGEKKIYEGDWSKT